VTHDIDRPLLKPPVAPHPRSEPAATARGFNPSWAGYSTQSAPLSASVPTIPRGLPVPRCTSSRVSCASSRPYRARRWARCTVYRTGADLGPGVPSTDYRVCPTYTFSLYSMNVYHCQHTRTREHIHKRFKIHPPRNRTTRHASLCLRTTASKRAPETSLSRDEGHGDRAKAHGYEAGETQMETLQKHTG
jgi:hypothetical protein